MTDETTPDELQESAAADDQGNDAPVVPTDEPKLPEGVTYIDAPGEQFYRHAETGELYVTGVDPNGEHYDVPAHMVSLDAHNALQAELAEANDRIAELESSPAGDDFGGVRTPALNAYEESLYVAEQQAFERDVKVWEATTGLSFDETEPEVSAVDPAIQERADAEPVG